MWEFDIVNTKTGETSIIFGYSVKDAFRRYPSYDPNEWSVTLQTYID